MRSLANTPVRSVALWRAGVLVDVPQPARLAVHKLVLAQKRDAANRTKRRKDLAPAKALIDVVERLDPFALPDALLDAAAPGRKGWAEPIVRSLTEIGKAEHVPA